MTSVRARNQRPTQKLWQTSIYLILAFAAFAASCQAAAVISPPGLNVGDTYRIIFVTSTGRNAQSSDINDYNAFVTAAALSDSGLASLGTTWRALASTATVNVLANTGLLAGDTTTPFFNTRGELIATGVTVPQTGLYGGPTTSRFTKFSTEMGFSDQYGPFLWATPVFTGTMSDGSTAVGHALGDASVLTGHTAISERSGWTDGKLGPGSPLNYLASSMEFSLYAVSGPLTVVPEPCTAPMLLIGAVALGLAKKYCAGN